MAVPLNAFKPLFSIPWAQSFPFLSAAVAGGFALPKTFQLGLPSLTDILSPWLLAVPKKKTSHSKKAMRASNKGLTDKTNIVNCPGCGHAKLAHHLCPHCYSQITRGHKREARLRDGQPGPWDGTMDA